MTKKKKKDKDEDKVFCWYCDRVFSDEATLILHQKAKHFKCPDCNRKLNTAQGLSTHCYQVHHVNIKAVPAAKPGRESMEIEIFGMAGVPDGARPGAALDDEPASKKARADGGDSSGMAPGSMPPPQQQQAYMQQQQQHYQQQGGMLSHGPPYSAPMPRPVVYPPGMYGGHYMPGMPPYHGPPPLYPPGPGAPQMPYHPQGMPPPGMGPPPHMMHMMPGMHPGGPHQHPGHLANGPPQPGMGPGMPLGPLGVLSVGPQIGNYPQSLPPGAAPLMTHPSGPPAPLFPISQAAPGPSLFPIGGNQPSSAAVDLSNNAAAEPTIIIWTDEDFSIEERRASLPKYLAPGT